MRYTLRNHGEGSEEQVLKIISCRTTILNWREIIYKFRSQHMLFWYEYSQTIHINSDIRYSSNHTLFWKHP